MLSNRIRSNYRACIEHALYRIMPRTELFQNLIKVPCIPHLYIFFCPSMKVASTKEKQGRPYGRVAWVWAIMETMCISTPCDSVAFCCAGLVSTATPVKTRKGLLWSFWRETRVNCELCTCASYHAVMVVQSDWNSLCAAKISLLKGVASFLTYTVKKNFYSAKYCI